MKVPVWSELNRVLGYECGKDCIIEEESIKMKCDSDISGLAEVAAALYNEGVRRANSQIPRETLIVRNQALEAAYNRGYSSVAGMNG